MVGYIYLITDTTNNMKYVGQHHYNKEGELDQNYHGSGVIIKNIYKKRPETLKEEYIKTCYSEEEMCSDEQHYIKVFDTLWPNGYNLTEGGEGEIPCEETRKKISESNKGRIFSDEHRRKLSLVNKGKHLSEETRKKISESTSGEKNPFYNKHHSEETRRKISDSRKGIPAHNKGKHPTEETRRKISEANKGKHPTEETRRKMRNAHSGEKHHFFGKKFSEEHRKKLSDVHKGKHLSEETREKLREANINGKCSKKVLQFTLDGEFVREWESTQECGRNGYSQSHVVNCCNGKRKSHKGFKWCYA